jgi:two-component sensor histidine kinase
MRFRLHCAALPEGAGGRALVLRCLSARNDQFSILGRRVRELDAQLRDRLRKNAILEETLRQNRDLMRELQHRVKNNIQMMASLIRMSAQGGQSDEVRALVDRARLRLQAMASAQDAIYRAKQAGLVAAAPLLSDLVQSIGESFGAADSVRLELAEATLSNDVAHSLALIANELTTNAIKHGRPDGPGAIRVAFGPVADGFELVVQDSGPGIPDEALARSSGLKLVRALCRQIGGRLDIAYENGTKCSVRFAADQ